MKIIKFILGWAADFWRMGAPTMLGAFAVVSAYAIGAVGGGNWWTLIPVVLMGASIGLAADRAEARAKSDFAERFMRLIEDDHTIDVTINHRSAA